jgi:hypothetical protein
VFGALVVMMVVTVMMMMVVTRRVIGSVLCERYPIAADGDGNCDGGDRRQAQHGRLQHFCLLMDEC